MHLEYVVIRVGQLDFDGLAARTGVDYFIRQQRVALRCGGFLDGDICVEGKAIKYRLSRCISEVSRKGQKSCKFLFSFFRSKKEASTILSIWGGSQPAKCDCLQNVHN